MLRSNNISKEFRRNKQREIAQLARAKLWNNKGQDLNPIRNYIWEKGDLQCTKYIDEVCLKMKKGQTFCVS